MGSLFERLASGAETAGAFGMSLITQPPVIATPLHLHTREAEAFYALDGTLIYQAGEELHHLAARVFHLPPAECAARVPDHRHDSGAVHRAGDTGRPDGPVRRGRHTRVRAPAARPRRPAARRGNHALERGQPEVRAQRGRPAIPADG